MSLTIFVLWDQQFTDNNGDPLAGGFVFSTITGTDTPSELFTDVDGEIPYSNPIELDSAGRFPGLVFQAAEPALDIMITDADEVPVMGPFGPVQAYAAAETPEPPCTPPIIVEQPQDQSVDAGDSVTVFVVATGTAPLTYQWFLGLSGDESQPIDGATSSVYTTLPLAAGSYDGWVKISNACGSANSLTVSIIAT